MDWFGLAKIDFVHAPTPRALKEKDGMETDLLKVVEASTPPCHLNPLLSGGHLQTMWTAFKPHGPQIYYRRKVFEADHKTYRGTFAVDFAVKPFEDHDDTLPPRTAYLTDNDPVVLPSDDSKPMLIVLHGLAGGSHEAYLKHCIMPLLGDGGWEVCVVNSRGCANSKITSRVLYNARATWDYRQVGQTVRWLNKTFPNRPLFGLGFSLGANMLTNYCAEESDKCLLKAAVICSNPFNLEVVNRVLQNRLVGREVYLRVMGMAMKQLAVTHKDELEKHSSLDFSAIEKVTYLHEFDREVQCPSWGYPTETAYYRDASSADALLNIRIPFVALQATDDPIAVKEALPYEEFRLNPNIVMITTSLGGHIGWFELGDGRWYPKPVCNLLNYFAHKIDLGGLEPSSESGIPENKSSGADYEPLRRRLEVREQ